MERRRAVDQAVEAYAWWVLRWRWPILIITVVATVLAARGGIPDLLDQLSGLF